MCRISVGYSTRKIHQPSDMDKDAEIDYWLASYSILTVPRGYRGVETIIGRMSGIFTHICTQKQQNYLQSFWINHPLIIVKKKNLITIMSPDTRVINFSALELIFSKIKISLYNIGRKFLYLNWVLGIKLTLLLCF